ncbi:hypothetical protein CC1G_13278 [Coprinopsis cinerea okayama7|uniref:Uncharacterized protein n=1 Tax=Coprinopsis cinerea (strain Okayama-7 / 130 / ATCC MYA-4618 / FGSC 9003) TaxID=240176 RepID=A8P5Z4_COPC7|nr:hypothetical protein CC1G_13278 [Coprinopsis cinerea okayama7\|eukprot:XP_001839055.2 hypothetical protein CC1G_13278 [Coprinopsis cinerea okayama7\
MASNRINDVPNNSSAFLPAPGMNPSDGGRPIHFGFFGGHPMDVNVDAGWEGATLHNGFHPRFKADELTTMTPVAGGVRDDNNSADASGSAAGPERKHPSMTPAGQGNVRSQILSDSKDDDIISISSYEDDGAKHCHIPGDSTYRAPGASRSRIKDVPNSDFTRVTRSKGLGLDFDTSTSHPDVSTFASSHTRTLDSPNVFSRTAT